MSVLCEAAHEDTAGAGVRSLLQRTCCTGALWMNALVGTAFVFDLNDDSESFLSLELPDI